MSILKDIKVLDLSRVLSGPFCSRMLADLGADVVKVESKEGDVTRNGITFKGEFSDYFTQFNVGKRCICVDFRSESGLELIKKLAAECDILLENFRPGTMKEIGLDYERIQAINPNIVYCSISGFGQTGEYANRPAFADIVHAVSGIDYAAANTGNMKGTVPGMPFGYADTNTSLNATIAILGALYHRLNTGEGQHIDIAMLDCILSCNDTTYQKAIFTDGEQDIPTEASQPPLQMKDGHIATSWMLSLPKMVQAIGRPELLQDPKFNTYKSMLQNLTEYRQIINDWAAKTTVNDAIAALEEADVPYGKVQTTTEVLASSVVKDRNMLVPIELPGVGKVPVINTPFRFSKVATGPQNSPSRKGENNKEVLQHWLQLSDAQYDALKQQKTIL